MADFGFLSFVHEPTLFRQLDNHVHPKDLTAVMVACTLRSVRLVERSLSPRLAGNRSPGALARADSLFNGVLHRVQKQVYEVYGAIELMVGKFVASYRPFERVSRILTKDCGPPSAVRANEGTLLFCMDALG
jgi:hypothetical protein